MKLLIVDDETIVYGSSNFDLISYLFEKEIVIQKKDRDLAQQLTQAALKLIN
jgi:phosphatidylserine/phosphatidylglycerophosphate/cardiolipin synthase-like enzyme